MTEATPPAIILVRPTLGENIGAAARAMMNFGLSEMRLVEPKGDWPNQKAINTASGAERTMGPILSSDQHSAMAPVRATRPKVGRRPVVPQRWDGETMEPSVSVPMALRTLSRWSFPSCPILPPVPGHD